MAFDWTERMSDVDLIEKRLTAELGRRPTLQRVADELGLCRESIRRYRWKIDRHHAQQRRRKAFYDDHVRLWRSWVFANSANVLPVLIAVAERAAAKYKPPLHERPRRRTTLGRPWVPQQLERVWVTTERIKYSRQEELQRRAASCHWTEVVYVSGTDTISHINRRR